MRIYILAYLMMAVNGLYAQKATVSWSDNGKTVNYFNYKVEQGDNLSRIAHKYGTTVKAIQKANPQLGKTLSLGAIIHIPVKKTANTTTTDKMEHNTNTISNSTVDTNRSGNTQKPELYIVKKGDTYSSIIRAYNIKDDTVFDKQNGLKNHALKIGQTLIVGYEKPVSAITKPDISDTRPVPLVTPPVARQYRSDTATLSALALDDCGSEAKYIFTSDYPLGTRLVLVNKSNNKSIAVIVTAEKPELKAYAGVDVLMSCSAAQSINYKGGKEIVKVFVTR